MLHIAGALYHGIVLKDGILSTMKPNFAETPGWPLRRALSVRRRCPCRERQRKGRCSEWSVKPAASQIAFEATGGGETTRGTFAQYRAEIEFDPDMPEQTAVRVLLDMNSAATGDADADQS